MCGGYILYWHARSSVFVACRLLEYRNNRISPPLSRNITSAVEGKGDKFAPQFCSIKEIVRPTSPGIWLFQVTLLLKMLHAIVLFALFLQYTVYVLAAPATNPFDFDLSDANSLFASVDPSTLLNSK